jgi:hypothetical protein
MISPDLLHQVIKGTFKDHLVGWVCKYLVRVHGEGKADAILDDINRRYVMPMTLDTPVAHLLTVLPQYHFFPDCAAFLMVAGSSSGQETTLRR